MGIDGGLTNFGLSVFGSKTERHTTALYKPKHAGARRLHDIHHFVLRVVSFLEANYEVLGYAMEGYSFASQAQHHKIGEGGGVTKLALVSYYGADDPIAYPTIVSPNTLKKFVLGIGKGKKSEMLLGVYRRWGIDFHGQDDMADAYALARVGHALLSGETKYKYEQEVVASLERNTEWEPPKQ